MELRPVASYARELRPQLPEGTFAPATSRVLWFPLHVGIIATLAWAMATGRLPMWSWPLASIVIGISFSGVTFLGHETMHGAVVKGGSVIRLLGWFTLLPFCLSPQLWTAWHNRVHHNNTGKEGVDPDMYPTIREYESDRASRIMADHFGVGRQRWLGFASLLVGFTGQSTQMLFGARKRGILSPQLHRRAIVESLLGVAFWVGVAVLVGPLAFVFVYLLPLIVANTIVMAFIMTNHNLSPLTNVNDPLVNSLSVTLPKPLEVLTLGFGFHTEHHLFPTASTRSGPVIRDAIRANFGERYQSLPLVTALGMLYRSARVYQDDVTLVDPPTGRTFPTLVPRPIGTRAGGPAAGSTESIESAAHSPTLP